MQTTIMALSPKRSSLVWFGGPNFITVVYKRNPRPSSLSPQPKNLKIVQSPYSKSSPGDPCDSRSRALLGVSSDIFWNFLDPIKPTCLGFLIRVSFNDVLRQVGYLGLVKVGF